MDGRYNSFVATVPLPDGVQIDDSWFHEVDSAKTAYAASSGARPVFHTTVRTPSGVTMNNTAVVDERQLLYQKQVKSFIHRLPSLPLTVVHQEERSKRKHCVSTKLHKHCGR